MSPVRVRQEALFAAKSFLRRFCLPKPSDSCSSVRFSFHTTSQSGLRPPAPLVGEPLAYPASFTRLPKPPLVRSNGDDRRQRRKQGVAVGAAASRMQATAKQTLGAATRAVAMRSIDGEVIPLFCKNPLQTSPRCGIIHLAASPLRIEYLPL